VERRRTSEKSPESSPVQSNFFDLLDSKCLTHHARVRCSPDEQMMNSLIVHSSNRLGNLAEELAKLVAEPVRPPLQQQIVVVPSLGLRRWLSLEIARRNGICANVSFPFISDFVRSLPPAVETGAKIFPRIPMEELTWAIHRILPKLLIRKEFAAVKSYLSDSDPLKSFQLSERLALLFDQYLVYRPDMIARWDSGQTIFDADEAWQAILWCELAGDAALMTGRHQLQKQSDESDFLWRSDRSSLKTETKVELPNRIFVFGLTALPPVYLEMFFRLAASREVHLFVLQPSSEYHGDDLTPKQRARRNIDPSEPITGNPLLTSLGRQNSHFTELLLETDERFGHILQEAPTNFVAPDCGSLLSTLQADILRAVNRGVRGSDFRLQGSDVSGDPASSIQQPVSENLGSGSVLSGQQSEVSEHDRSLQIHSCHSPMREVEVLYDQLLEMFEQDATLRPRDILVMTPEIEKYSPLIRAVFEYPEDAKRQIPYSISDRHPRTESVIIDAFLSLLDLPTSRCTAEEIFGFISSPVVAQRFAFSEDDLSLIRTWIQNTGIAWGVDAAHRERVGLPATDRNTWQFGLNRLLLGYAMKGNNRTLFEEILPYDEVESDGGEILGRLVSVTEAIFDFVEKSQVPRPLTEWALVLREAVDDLLESDDEEDVRDLRFLRRIIAGLEGTAENAGADQNVEFAVIRHHLSGLLAAMEQRGAFLTGGVTFCALKPARSIPARVIFLLGVNDEVFPRQPQPPEFDLMSQKWRLGDPSPREDDRYAFLETIMSAGESLHISYLGRSMIHNQEIPPSVVISELFDYLDHAFLFPGGAKAKDYLTLEHPLQAFSPRYFDVSREDKRLFSYSEANAAATAAAVAARPAAELRPFLSATLSEPDPALRAIALEDLVAFLAGPAKYFLRARLGLKLKDFDSCLTDDEPINLDALTKYRIRQDLLTERIDTNTANLKVFAARGVVPLGTMGDLQLRSLDRVAENFTSMVRTCIGDGKKGEPLAVDLHLGDFSLTGRIEAIYGGKIVHYRCAALNLRDRLRAWVDHLSSCATGGGAPDETLLIGMDVTLAWEEISKPKEILEDLCQLFWEGLRRPLPFFPDSALALVEAERAGAPNPLKKAAAKWRGGYDIEGEKEKAENRKLFGQGDPLNGEFIKLAKRIWGPLAEHARKVVCA
jgi:exodeoxyribonuclease V gamma subunit